jgi:malonyl-CoA O-methyltransferase
MNVMSTVDKKRIQKNFDGKADRYESCAILQKEVCQRMLERLDLVALQPNVIVDCGAGTGWGVQGLMQRYKKANVIAVDISLPMLQQSRRKGGWLRKPGLLCADAEALPLQDESVDLVFSNLMLQWCDAQQVFSEFKRILKPGGLLMFSTFGTDTLKELKASWRAVDDDLHVNEFADMHDLGDALLQTGLAEPVMDMDVITLTYKDALSVMTDLKSIGANTALNKSNKGLMTPEKIRKVIEAYEEFRRDDLIPASFEVVFGHAWKLQQRPAKMSSSEFSISLADIPRPHK